MTDRHASPGLRLLVMAAALALGALLAMAFATGRPAAAGPPIDDLILPIEVEESRDVPKRVTRDVQGQGASITQTTTTLVSNTGQSAGAAATNLTIDRAQAFTTGSNSSGYTLTSVQLNLQEVGSQTITFIVTLHEDSSGTPSTTSLGTLATTTTTLPSTFGLLQYNASGNGISLDANKTYWVLIDVAGATGNHTQTQTTTSGDEDSGGATGWSIASDHLGRGSTATDWSASATVSGVIHIRINGSAKGPPEPQSIQNVQGTQKREVEIAFDKNLDASSTPHHGNFQARFPFFGGTTYTSSGVKITGDKVNLIFPVTIGTGIPEWVKYTKPSSGNKLKGTNGVEVASFTFPEQAQTTPPPRTPSSGFTPPPSRDDGGRVAPGPWISPRPHRVDLSGTDVIVSMDKAVVLDTANYTTAQLAAKFTVWVNGDRRAVEGASVSGYQVTLDLGSSYSAPAGARVAVNYARGPLLDATTTEKQVVGGFSYSPGPWYSPRPNRVDATSTGVVVSMDKPVQLDSSYSASQLAAAFTVRVNGTAHKPTGATVSGRDIHLDIGHPVADADKVDVDYTKGPLQDSTGMRVSGFNYAGVGG